MLIHNSSQTTQETILRWKQKEKIAFVPTMGCLHPGHLDLVQRAKKFGQKVVVSIFVNPLQFAPGEDFEKYPRTFEQDRLKLEEAGVDLLFHPTPKDLYPDGFSTSVKVGDIAQALCGKFRPGHFDGVATVCLKLFSITQCDFAVFGEKDFQQLRVIQQLVSDFNLPLTIVPNPTVRDVDGLALSSRNSYLSLTEREHARVIPLCLQRIKEEIKENGACRVKDIRALALRTLQEAPISIQYAEVTSGRWLKTPEDDALIHAVSMPHFFVAAKVGNTRLIDNISLNGDHT